MALAVLFSLAASLCTAASSVCQRLGAVGLPRAHAPARFDPLLVFRLARRPVWLLGFAGMLAGFGCQLTALHFGPLALVQPILAVELPLVFGYLAVRAPGRVRHRDWLAGAAMAAAAALFLLAASPSGGGDRATAAAWWTAATACGAAVAAAVAAGRVRLSPAWCAACLGVATGIAWGFVAALIKELSGRIGAGPSAVFTSWPVYALMAAGAAGMLLTAHAMAAGPLAASQPGFTVLDPVTATLLGAALYHEQLRTTPSALAAQFLALLALIAGAWTLARGPLITAPEPGQEPHGTRRMAASP